QGPRVVMLMRKFYPLTGGYQNQALRLARELMTRGVQISVVTQRHGTLAPYEVYQQIPIYRVSTFQAGHLASFSFLLSAFLWMVKNRQQFQIIHAQRSSSGLVAGLIGFMLRKGVLYKVTRGDEIDIKGFRTAVLGRVKVQCLKRTVDWFVSTTKETEVDLKDIGIPSHKVVVIPNGMSLEGYTQSYDRERIKSEMDWDGETTVVTFVGRLVRAKGIDWLLKVWQHVARQHRQGRLLIVGDGVERSALEAQAQTLGIADRVAFVGRQEDVFKFLAISDVFVLPSRLEGTANALLEAMSQKLPVVVANDSLGGNREVIDDQKDGYVVKFGDSEACAEILVTLLRNPELRQEMGKRARQRLEEKFSIKDVADRYSHLYEQLTVPQP
ncbi:MAG: glycosyltransferase family 4 protein, partial [Candidatus Binatia bacterium]